MNRNAVTVDLSDEEAVTVDLSDEEAFALVKAECRVGGKPLALYEELHFTRRDERLGIAATLAIVRNLEDRIVELERWAVNS